MVKRICSMFLLAFMIFAIFATSTQAFADVKYDKDAKGLDVNGIKIGYGLGRDGMEVSEDFKNTGIDNGLNKVGESILGQYKTAITGVSGVLALTFVMLFLLNFAKLGKSAGNPQMRSQALTSIIWTGVAAACTGGVAIFFGFFYQLGVDFKG